MKKEYGGRFIFFGIFLILDGVFSDAHRYAILGDDKTYCKLDLIKEIKCYKIDK